VSIRVNGRGLGALGEQVLLLGGLDAARIIGEVGPARPVPVRRGWLEGQVGPSSVAPTRPAWLETRAACPGTSSVVRVNTARPLPSAPRMVEPSQLGARLGGLRGLRLGFDPGREAAPTQQVYVPRLPRGPHVAVGPFTFPTTINEYSFSASYNKLVATSDGRELMTSILIAVGRVSTQHLKMNGCYGTWSGHLAAAKFSASCPTPTVQNLVEPRYEDRDKATFGQWRGLNIPSDRLWDTRFLTGVLPVFKFVHPTKKESWGVFVNFVNGTWNFSVKKVPPADDWLSKIWGMIKALVAKIVEFYGDIFDALKGLACSLAGSYLSTLSQVAARDPKLDLVAANAQFAKIGVGPTQLNSLWQGTMEAQAAQALAVTVKDKLCAVDAPPGSASNITPATSGSGAAVVAVAGGGALLLYFLLA